MVLWVLVCSFSYSSDEVKLTSPNHTTVHDDHYAEVPLQFVFPFYGEEFETSYMFTNGVVGFRNPTDSQVESHWCCNGRDLQTMAENEQNISRYGYAIAPLWTDLIDLGAENSGLFTEGDASQQTYRWKNLAEYYNASRLNSFELQIKQDGSYTVDYTAVNIQNHAITIGESGDLSTQSSYEGTQNYYYPSGYQGVPQGYGNEQNSINVLNTLCSANPLYDPQCSGYAEAYAQQLYITECNQNTLYDSGCSGYEEAYFLDQCTTDATYSRDCNGYEEAYLEQQCMYDPQYDTTCAGYVNMEEQEPSFVTSMVDDGSIIQGDNPVNEVLEQPDIITDFANTSGYEIEGMPSASAQLFEMPQVFEPEVLQVEPEPIEAPVQEMQQELEREIAVVEPQPSELEQGEMEESDVGEEPIEEVVQRERELEEREEQSEEREEPREELEVVEEREESVEEQDDGQQEQPIEKTVANKQAPKKIEKKQVITKNDKLKTLVSKRAVALAKKVESAVTLEQQIVVQQQLMSLISFVPDFNYAEQKMKDLASFYPSKDNVDNAFARWFVNDKNFIKLEDLQYPQRNTQWQR